MAARGGRGGRHPSVRRRGSRDAATRNDFGAERRRANDRSAARVQAPTSLGAIAVDPHTVRVRWEDRVAAAHEAPTPLPHDVFAEELAAHGPDGVAKIHRSRAAPTLGPYRVARFVANESLTLEANPFFPGP